jgi:cysteine desulfurase family protein (TIGR01976 family)
MTSSTVTRLELPERFPALEREDADGRRYVHADAPGGTQVPVSVIDAMTSCLTTANASPNRVFLTSTETLGLMTDSRISAARFLDADPDDIVFGPNMTSLTWHFAHAFAPRVSPGDNLVCTQLDHDANVAPWLAIAGARGAEVRLLPIDPLTTTLRTDLLPEFVDQRTRLVAFTLCSNFTGTVIDPRPFVDAAAAVGAVSFADGVAAVGHAHVSQRHSGYDVLVCSPYKWYGPHSGVLSIREHLRETLMPDRVRPAADAGPRRWETGMPSFEALAGVHAAVEYVERVGLDEITAWEHVIAERALAHLAGVENLQLYGLPTADGRAPTLTFNVDNLAPKAVAERLAAQRVFVSAGHNYAIEPTRALGLEVASGAVRMGFAHYHSLDEVDYACQAVADVAAQARLG